MSQYVESYSVRPKTIDWTKLIVCLIGTVGLGVLCSYFSGAWRNNGYVNISTATPPFFVMYITWPILYMLMGTSLYAVIDHKAYSIRSQNLKKISLTLWATQFMLVLLLPFLLYKLDLYLLSFVLSSLITAFVAALAVINLKISAPATVLLVPYLAWMIFETYLILIIVINNF